MPPGENEGRIPRDAFVISTSVLFGVALLAVPLRIYLRIRFPGVKRSKIDDAFLVIAACSMTAALVILHVFTIDDMYLAEAIFLNVPGLVYPPNVIERLLDFHKWVTVVLMLSWCGIMAVKFSFLFFFRQLLDKVSHLQTYWWIVTVFNVCVLGYGAASYYLACPYYYSLKSLSCNTPAGMKRLFAHATAQMVLDIAGDVTILYIPLHLVWTRKDARKGTMWRETLALSLTLCIVTIFMLATAVIRVSSIWYRGLVDMAWATYWIIISSEIGVLMSTAASLHIYSVSSRKEKNTLRNSSATTKPESNRLSKCISQTWEDMKTFARGSGNKESIVGERQQDLEENPRALIYNLGDVHVPSGNITPMPIGTAGGDEAPTSEVAEASEAADDRPLLGMRTGAFRTSGLGIDLSCIGVAK